LLRDARVTCRCVRSCGADRVAQRVELRSRDVRLIESRRMASLSSPGAQLEAIQAASQNGCLLNRIVAVDVQYWIAMVMITSYVVTMRRQGRFEFRTWGGKRRGAGRKRVAARPQVAHRTRERVNARHPILVTTRVVPEVARLRTPVMYDAIRTAMALATKWMYEPEPFRIVHASVQGSHLHLLVEAASNAALTRGMKGFLVSCARRLNGIAGRTGKVFSDRFHSSSLATPRQVRNALLYTLANWRKHGEARSGGRLDPYSSAFALPDWMSEPSIRLAAVPAPMPVALPRTWLLAEGWRRAGPISPWTRPGAA
jgi:putative transposase